MAKRKARSGLAARLGEAGRKAVENHKNDDTRLTGGGDLPAGIENGVAQLVQCYFKQYEKGDNVGKDFFYAAGIVKLPTEHEGVPVEGQRTWKREPLYATPTFTRKTVEDHLDWVLNQLRLLGVDTTEVGVGDLEDVVAALEQEQPHFRFRTWKGAKQTEGPFAGREPRVQHDWRGACEYEGDAVEDVVDKTEDESAEDDSEPKDDGLDYEALGEQADAGDEAAQETLTRDAEEAGLDPDEYPTWVELATALDEGDSDDAPPAAEEDYTPQPQEVWGFKPPRAKKVQQFEIKKVDEGKRTVDIVSLQDGRAYKGISFNLLEDLG